MDLDYLTRKPKLDLRLSFVQLKWFEEGVATLTINRPERKNALNGSVIEQLSRAFEHVNKYYKRYHLRALVLSAAGNFFCAGADLEYMREMGLASKRENIAEAKNLSEMMYLAASLPVYLISSVLGGAFGGALGLLAASDLVVAEHSALFATSEVTLGLAPAIISPYLVRKLGYSGAASLMLSGERIQSPRAKEIGLINEIFVDKGSENAAIRSKLSDVCRSCPQGIWRTKQLILKLSLLPSKALRTSLISELSVVRATKEAREGLDAFLAKRLPNWHVRI